MSAWTQNEKMQSHVLKCVILMAWAPSSCLAPLRAPADRAHPAVHAPPPPSPSPGT
jgi:hypothetical protein